MTALPDALRPWREWLSWFEPDLAAQLGPMLQRLLPLLGSFKGSTQGGEPELEGLDDLRSRGKYQHLLASEWLLAEDMPDEFLRRAASGEHMFLAPRPRARRADSSIVALFDTGPLQLGAPRLAHLALWILLARRAQQAGARFVWGSLQSPGELLEAQTAENLKALLFKRTFALSGVDGLANWRNTLDARRSGGEIWAVGSFFDPSELQAAPFFTHRVCVHKDLQGAMLEVSLFERGTERAVRLPLPEPGPATALLRGWFERKASPQRYVTHSRAVALMRPPVISFGGGHVGVALRDEPGALVFELPRTPNDRVRGPRRLRWTAGHDALAMAGIGGQTGVLLSGQGELRFRGNKEVVKMPLPSPDEFHAPGGTAVWLWLGWLRNHDAQRVYVLDQSKRLLQWDISHRGLGSMRPAQSLQLQAQNVLAVVQLNTGMIAYACYEQGKVWLKRLSMRGEWPSPRSLGTAPENTAVLFGPGNVCAIRLNEHPAEKWAFGSGQSRFNAQAQLPNGSRAIGLFHEPSTRRTSLIAHDRNILRLHFSSGGNEVLYTAPERIVSCSVCPTTATVAMLTQQRQLIVLSAVTRELRLSVQTSAKSDESA